MLGDVAPVRPDVGKRARRTGFDSPIPIRIVQQPILRICPLYGVNIAKQSRFSQAADVLHLGVGPYIVQRAVRELPSRPSLPPPARRRPATSHKARAWPFREPLAPSESGAHWESKCAPIRFRDPTAARDNRPSSAGCSAPRRTLSPFALSARQSRRFLCFPGGATPPHEPAP